MRFGTLIHLAICLLGAISFEMAPELKKIFKGLSWGSRMQLLDKYYPDTNSTKRSMDASLHERTSVLPPITPKARATLERKVAIEELNQSSSAPARRLLGGHTRSLDAPAKDDESHMKTKLFRLMYETIRDSDLKVKRAELIKSHYTNSSSFEVGYLLGEVTEKFNIMTDIAVTVKRLYSEWKPIEHINAYEQIANQAIEISHLIDIVRTTHKVQNRPKGGRRGEIIQ